MSINNPLLSHCSAVADVMVSEESHQAISRVTKPHRLISRRTLQGVDFGAGEDVLNIAQRKY